MNKPSFSFEDAQRFLNALDPQAKAFTFQTFDDKKGRQEFARVLNGSFSELSKKLFELNEQGAGLYVTVALTNLKGRKTENIIEPRAVFCDFDGVEPARGAGALPVSIRVQSKNGKHLYWLLKSGQDMEKWSQVQVALAKKLGADEACKDAPRVMRLPGSLHHKEEPFQVSLIDSQADRRYTLDDVIKAYGLELEEPPPKPTKVWPSREGTGPADDFNARGDWSFLERYGWTLIRHYGEEGRWRRPGKDQGQLSATTDHQGHTGIFYCFSSNAEPFEANKAYSRFQVFSILEHGGDYKTAAKALVEQGYGDDNREQWLAERVRERNEADWERVLEAGPPPDLERPRRQPPRQELEPPPYLDEGPEPTDDDVPPEHRANGRDKEGGTSKRGGRRGGGRKGGKGRGKKGSKRGGGKRPPLTDPEDGLVDFRVSKVKVLTSLPPVYYLEIEGSKILELTLDDLDSPKRFRKCFMKYLHRRPSVPTDDEDWNMLVNYWLAMREEVDQPEEASFTGRVRAEIRDMLRGLAQGDHITDLDRGRILAHPKEEGVYLVKFTALLALLKDRMGNRQLDEEMIAAQMRGLKCSPVRIRPTRRAPQIRLWAFRLELDDPDGIQGDEGDEEPEGRLLTH